MDTVPVDPAVTAMVKDPTFWSVIISALLGGGGVTAILAKLGVLRLKSTKQNQDHADSLMTRFSERIGKVEQDHEDCLKKHQKCLEDSAQMREELGGLKEAVKKLHRRQRKIADESGIDLTSHADITKIDGHSEIKKAENSAEKDKK